MVSIREATEADHEAVTALLVIQLREHAVATPTAAIAGAVRELLTHPRRGRILVASLEGRAIGVAALSFLWPLEHGGRSSWLEELYVEPSHRGQGIGGELLRAACALAAASGAHAVDLEVDAAHARATRLYAREGFTSLPRARWVRRLEPATVAPARLPASVTGGCFCGAVRYRADAAPIDVTHCHCAACRRTSGAPFVTWATFPAAAFTFVTGAPAELRSSAHAVRTFCAACGTALTFREEARPRSVDVTVGSLDEPEALVPRSHTWTVRQLPWLHLDDDLPRHAEGDPDEV
jgi:GNAT superfamily N-acetyltransferase